MKISPKKWPQFYGKINLKDYTNETKWKYSINRFFLYLKYEKRTYILVRRKKIKRIGLVFAKTGSSTRKMWSGCPKATTKREYQRIKCSALRDRKELTKFVEELKPSDRKTLSRRTIIRRLQENRIMSKIYAMKILLKKKRKLRTDCILLQNIVILIQNAFSA